MADESIPDIIQRLSDQFDEFCQARHLVGQQKYGEFTFLENDIATMLVEELADMANYARMQYIKVMMLQGLFEVELAEKGLAKENGEVTIGVKSFKGAGE